LQAVGDNADITMCTTIMPPQSRYSKAGLTVLDLKVGKRVISKASRLDLHLQQCTSRCI